MREILFRGIAKSHGTFEFGDLITSIGKTYIGNTIGNNPDDWCEVIPETLGQFTGLTDKNGVKIFEGDIVRNWAWKENFKISFSKNEIVNSIYSNQLVIIGNIHDNS